MPTPAIPNYTVLRKIGSGAYGDVHLSQSQTGSTCAIKIVYRERCDTLEHFLREQRAVSFFTQHVEDLPGIIRVTDRGEDETQGIFWYAMPLADDLTRNRVMNPLTYHPDTLAARLESRIALAVSDCIALGRELANTLDRLHGRGLLHRDIKPGNVLFIKDQPVIADIGLVTRCTEAASVVGSPDYLPPENHGSYAGDVYSLGKLLYVAATGRAASDYPGVPKPEADVKDPRFPKLLEIIFKACAEDTRRRYSSAAALLADLTQLEPPYGRNASISLTLGIVGLIIWPIASLSIPLSIIGIVQGIKGRLSNKRKRAIAGLILNGMGILIAIIWTFISAWLLTTDKN